MDGDERLRRLEQVSLMDVSRTLPDRPESLPLFAGFTDGGVERSRAQRAKGSNADAIVTYSCNGGSHKW